MVSGRRNGDQRHVHVMLGVGCEPVEDSTPPDLTPSGRDIRLCNPDQRASRDPAAGAIARKKRQSV